MAKKLQTIVSARQNQVGPAILATVEHDTSIGFATHPVKLIKKRNSV